MLLLINFTYFSCKKKFQALNTNPNAATTIDPAYLLTQSMLKGVGQFSSGVHSEIWTFMEWNMMMANMAGVSQPGLEYAYSNDYSDELWRDWYAGTLANVQEVINITKDDPYQVNKNAVARIWRAYLFHRITDLWGDVPYFDAVKGLDPDGAILQPAYDPQQSIYADLQKELREAANSFDPKQDGLDGADVLLGGDLTRWQRFANSLRLRLALRTAQADPNGAAATVQALMNDNNFFTDATDAAHFQYNSTKQSPFYELYNSGQGMRNPSHFLLHLLDSLNDPRLPIYATPSTESILFGDTAYVGIPNLISSDEASSYNNFNTSAVGPWFLDVNTPGTTFSYAEVCFLQAEAALKGWGGSQTAQTYYENGVRAAMQRFGIADSSIAFYLNNSGQYKGTLEQIITQKWLTFVYQDAYEAFAEYRRTGFPAYHLLNGTPVDPTTVPQRLPYPLSEVSLNGNNVQAVGEGINDKTSKVWWAK